MITKYTLEDALKNVGNAEAFIGDPFTADGLVSLGAVEGGIRVRAPKSLNKLTAPELTGDIAHQATVVPGETTVTIPLISDGDLAALFAKIAPNGIGGDGYSSPIDVFTTSLVIIPRKEIGGGLEWDTVGTQWSREASGSVVAATGAGAAPKGGVWLWRATPNFDEIPFLYENGGKQMVDVTFTAMWYDGAETIPEGHKVYTVGDPRRVGVAIEVVL